MRHLKEYKIFESKISIEDIKDILLELDDAGFRTDINYYICYRIEIQKPKMGTFIYREVEDVIERLKKFLVDRIISIFLYSREHHDLELEKFKKFDNFEEIKISGIEIKFNR